MADAILLDQKRILLSAAYLQGELDLSDYERSELEESTDGAKIVEVLHG